MWISGCSFAFGIRSVWAAQNVGRGHLEIQFWKFWENFWNYRREWERRFCDDQVKKRDPFTKYPTPNHAQPNNTLFGIITQKNLFWSIKFHSISIIYYLFSRDNRNMSFWYIICRGSILMTIWPRNWTRLTFNDLEICGCIENNENLLLCDVLYILTCFDADRKLIWLYYMILQDCVWPIWLE